VVRGSERNYIWGREGQETISPVFKVPRQCPFVLLAEIMQMIGIKFVVYDVGRTAL
jgi:hypothetical protein